MLNRHFLKSVLGFVTILAFGLVILFVLNEFDKSASSDTIETKAIDSRPFDSKSFRLEEQQ